MSIKSKEELEGMTEAAKAVAVTLNKMRLYTRPGMTTQELDEYGHKILSSFGANAAPKKEYNFPGWTCISVNHEAAHGIPSTHVTLKEGDLINIDVSAELNGYYGDNGCSFVVGNDINNHQPLVDASKEILLQAISKIKGGVKISAIGNFIETEAKKRGLTTIKNLVGHGIGRSLHEEPSEIPNFNDKYNRSRFKKDTVIAVETFISTKARFVHEQADGWTLKAHDGSYVAQHEHTLIVTDGNPIILTEENGIDAI